VERCARLRAFQTAALAAALTACASPEAPPGFVVSPEHWRAGVARRGADLADAPNPMDVTAAMTTAAKELGGTGGDEERLERLRAALLDGRAFTFEYERSTTFSAADAFENRRGNCVSFTNLFIALGRSLGIRLQAALVSERGVSEREGDLIMTYDHMVAVYPLATGRTVKVYDFYRMAEEPGRRLTLLDDFSVTAIRASNSGIAHLGRDEHAEAEHDLEIAVKLGPQLGFLHASLGLAKWRKGDVVGAFAALRRGLDVEPRCPPLLQNLAGLYLEQQKPAEARAPLAALDSRRASPYGLIVRGDLEMPRGQREGRHSEPPRGRAPRPVPRRRVARDRPCGARARPPRRIAQGRKEGPRARARERGRAAPPRRDPLTPPRPSPLPSAAAWRRR
jgi:tetratricopeptide (TPR) repeat protein